MNYVDLPDLRGFTNGFALRTVMARAISQVEMLATHSPASAQALFQTLDDFLNASLNAAYAAGGSESPAPQ